MKATARTPVVGISNPKEESSFFAKDVFIIGRSSIRMPRLVTDQGPYPGSDPACHLRILPASLKAAGLGASSDSESISPDSMVLDGYVEMV
jgi:hypothetical protein